jgi:hypothetical protein
MAKRNLQLQITLILLAQKTPEDKKKEERRKKKRDDERLGRQLLEGRKGKSNENYGDWINCNFPNLQETVSDNDRTAIVWAAEFLPYLHHPKSCHWFPPSCR